MRRLGKTLERLLISVALIVWAAGSAADEGVTVPLSSHTVENAYTMDLDVGTPPQKVAVVMDTGSANLFFLGDSSICDNCTSEVGQAVYTPSLSTSAEMSGTDLSIHYGSGSLAAKEVSDKVTVGHLTLDYAFGVMTHDAGIQNILGLAYKAVAQPTGEPLTPYFDALVKATGIADEFSMKLCNEEGSTITFGPSDVQVADYIPIVQEKWYVVSPKELQTADGKSLGKFSLPTVVDSGTTNLLVTSKQYKKIMKVLNPVAKENGIVLSAGFIRASADVIDKFPVLEMTVENTQGQEITLDISPRTYFRPAGPAGFLFHIAATNTSEIILGQVFMKNYHVVFDRANRRIGFAPSTGCQ